MYFIYKQESRKEGSTVYASFQLGYTLREAYITAWQSYVYGVRDHGTFEILTGGPVRHRATLVPNRSASLSHNV